MPSPVNTTLFRVAQEALNNVLKHAGASRAELSLSYDEDAVNLAVRDNGRGFDPRTLTETGRSSWGLLGMEERANLLGGKWELESSRGNGTSVRVRIPYTEGGEARDDDQIAAG